MSLRARAQGEGRRGRKSWLEVLTEGLERLGVPVRACRACAGEALLVLGDEADPLEVAFTRDGEQPFVAEVGGLFVRYRGGRELSTSSRRALSLLLGLIERLGPLIADDLDDPFVRGHDQLPPHQSLAFAFPFCTAERVMTSDGPTVSEVLLRVTGRCNQACPFCSAPLPRPGGDPPKRSIERLIERLAAVAPRATLTLTGGEPTLRRDLPDLVQLALDRSPETLEVKVQTNAVRLADRSAVEPYASTPRLSFFVSLHAMDSARYDECTATRGMLERALQGIENLLDRGHGVVLSVVATRVNASGLVSWVEAVADRFGSRDALAVHFSTTLCQSHRPAAAEWLVDYRVLGPELERAVERALSLGLSAEPLLSSSHAAIPACCLSAWSRARLGRGGVVEPVLGSERQEGSEVAGFVKPSSCRACAFDARCVGVPEAYAVRFGVDHLRPVA